jgi:hypothetical protein
MKTGIGILLAGLALAPMDIDVAVPPGTPLEWDKDLHQPVPTGWRGKVPTTDRAAEAGKAAPAGAPQKGATVVSHAPIDFGTTNLYRYFGVTTRDIMNHIKVEAPGGGLYKKDDVATGGGSGLQWTYKPEHPTELVWVGVAGCLRSILHPELVSVPETVAYLCEVGETTLPGTQVTPTPVGEKVRAMVTPIPEPFPPVRAGVGTFDSMLNRLVVVELTTGFPHSLDPTFARRTLALGDRAWRAVLESTRANHSLLVRNAVSVLSNYKNPEAVEELRKLLRSGDAVVKYRALSGLGRQRDRGAVPLLVQGLASADEVWRAACAYTLGMIGDPAAAEDLIKAARATGDLDFLWSLLPAIARLAGPKKEFEDFFALAEKAVLQGGLYKEPPAPPKNMVPPKPEPPGTKLQVVVEMCRLGLAAAGHAGAREQIKAKFQANGIDAFYAPNQILACNVFGKMNDGRAILQQIVETAKSDRVAMQALLDLREQAAENDWLKAQALKHRVAGVRALALTELFERGETHFSPVGQEIIDGYAGGTDGAQAYVVGTALQLMGKTSTRNKVDSAIAVVTRAHAAGMWARREGENTVDIIKANIRICPPLLEIAAIELGRLGDPKGIPALVAVLKSDATGGRGEAALGLGAIAGREAVDALVAALDDPKDGWVRFCAYEALRKLSGQDHSSDWMFGTPGGRSRAVARFREWAKSGAK